MQIPFVGENGIFFFHLKKAYLPIEINGRYAFWFIIRPANGFPDKWVLSSDLGTIILADRIELLCFYFNNLSFAGDNQSGMVMFCTLHEAFLSQVYAFVDFALHFINLILAHYRFLRCIGL